MSDDKGKIVSFEEFKKLKQNIDNAAKAGDEPSLASITHRILQCCVVMADEIEDLKAEVISQKRRLAVLAETVLVSSTVVED